MAIGWEQACLTLRLLLADATYPPGLHLREEDVAAQLGVSRTPMHEALRQPDAEGWLHVVQNQDAFATEWSRQDIEEILGLRALLEAHAAEHSAAAPTAHGMAALRAAYEAGEAALPANDPGSIERVSEANLRVHQAVMRAHVQAGKALFLAATRESGDRRAA